MKLNYKYKLFLAFFAIFAIFTTGVVVIERSREHRFKTEALEERLDSYAGTIDKCLRQSVAYDSLVGIMPADLRITIIDRQGNVQYDNVMGAATHLENHSSRPEIISATQNEQGSFVRLSTSNNREYLYYAKRYTDYFVRVALPYDIKLQHILQADNMFLYFILILFAATLLVVNFAAGRFGKSVERLRDFAFNPDHTTPFTSDELGEIGRRIAENYRQSQQSKNSIALEREKLMQHIHTLEEGVCFFSPEGKVEFYNGLFLQYVNTIADKPGYEPSSILSDPLFSKVAAFLAGGEGAYAESQISRHGKHFVVRINRFDDRSFEIIIDDNTKQKKTQLLKQEMTGNIAHELRTPVTAIRGYLETILSGQKLDPDKQLGFLDKAYRQTLVLSELIQDMGLITKIEESPRSFPLEKIVIRDLLDTLCADLETELQHNRIRMELTVGPQVVVQGNRNLLYSIFRNLTDNVIRYAGSGVTIFISKYNEDDAFYYFSYADNGAGISDESHLNRLFERFYRISEGRTRDTGGSGLGLSIVKNAVTWHHGTITVKNRIGGGLEFLFQLPK